MTRARRGDGRVVAGRWPVRLGDVNAYARLRLDAVARYLQDIAGEDSAELDLPEHHGWILRRLALDLPRLPSLGHVVELETRCTGVGGRWAERTTTITERGRLLVTARAVWVYVELESGAPRPLPPEFFAAYGDGVRDHRVSARLTLPKPDVDAPATGWTWRRTDIDVFDHVNNANYWAPVEEWLGGAPHRVRAAEMEFGAGIEPGEATTVAVAAAPGEATFWFCVDGDARATARLHLESIT
ncbi:MAG: acyl-[acyl-carrier-protein] thioesterase [Acidimicrobiia bacterium]